MAGRPQVPTRPPSRLTGYNAVTLHLICFAIWHSFKTFYLAPCPTGAIFFRNKAKHLSVEGVGP